MRAETGREGTGGGAEVTAGEEKEVGDTEKGRTRGPVSASMVRLFLRGKQEKLVEDKKWEIFPY